MIYFDNAATSFPKPDSVIESVKSALLHGASVGRSNHKQAKIAENCVYECRKNVCHLFHIKTPENVVFTYNATMALNLAIKTITSKYKSVAISPYEHNSVVRPLYALQKAGVKTRVLNCKPFDGQSLLDSAEKAAICGVKLFILTCVSNVFGYILPITALHEIAEYYHIKIILDASQSAGIVDLDLSLLPQVSAVCMPGHKSLLGPQGTGVLIFLDNEVYDTWMEGGTGSVSSDKKQPDFLPDRLECGTVNYHGIAGLSAGIQWILKKEPNSILCHERELSTFLADGLKEFKNTDVIWPKNPEDHTGVISFLHTKIPCEVLAEQLAQEDISTRAGLHCAPLAHQNAGTFKTGTVRLSPGIFNTKKECEDFLEIYDSILKKSL